VSRYSAHDLSAILGVHHAGNTRPAEAPLEAAEHASNLDVVVVRGAVHGDSTAAAIDTKQAIAGKAAKRRRRSRSSSVSSSSSDSDSSGSD
jgi:hypothetical protein